ncbi:MAG: hypothetical protein GF308_13935 [Candidatus Heimdallarchaeota archaeon]|nr:hypothetical protein [Candidatus Heimdallarchaeota archaeon]
MTVPYELHVIHINSGVQLFSYIFREDITLDPTLIAGFITAVISFAEEMKPSEGKEIIKFIDRGDFVLQIERGKLVVGLLILNRKDYSFRDKLRILVNEFETKYQEKIKNFTGISTDFDDFDEQVKQLISSKPLSPYHIPKLTDTDRAPKNLDDIKWKIITQINGENDINTISEELELSVEVVQSIIAYFEEVGLVKTTFVLRDNCVLELTRKGLKSLEVGSENYQELLDLFGEDALNLIGLIGTERVLCELKEELNETEEEEIEELVEKLVAEKYLEIVPQWKVVLDQEAFHFTRTIEFIEDVFQFIFNEANKWLNLRDLEQIKKNTLSLTLLKNEEAAKLLDERADFLIKRNHLKNLLTQTKELDGALKQIETVFLTLQGSIEREIGSILTKDILTKVSRQLEGEYPKLIQEQKDLLRILSWLKS